MQYLSKILLLRLTANLAARNRIRDLRTKAMVFPHTSKTRHNEALTRSYEVNARTLPMTLELKLGHNLMLRQNS